MKTAKNRSVWFTVGLALGLAWAMAGVARAADQHVQLRNTTFSWTKGNLGSANSVYVEGSSVPFRYEITGIANNGDVYITLFYDFTKGGIGTYDFLTTYDQTEAVPIAASGGLFGNNVLSTVTTNQGLKNALAIPDDPLISYDNLYANTYGQQYLSIHGFYTNAFFSGGYVLTGTTNGTSERSINLVIQGVTNGQIAIAWGGHIAVGSTEQWGPGKGAGSISGSPFHQNTSGFVDDNKNGVQNSGEASLGDGDRSMSSGVVVPVADLELTKDVDNATPLIGSNVVFTVTVTNKGPSDALGIEVRDVLPAGLVYVSHSNGTYNSGTGAWTIGAMAVNQSTSLYLTAQVTSLTSITNWAEISAAGQIDLDSTPNNNVPSEDDQDFAVVNPQAIADLELTKTASTLSPLLGSNVIFTVVVANKGPSAVSSLSVRDLLPAGLAFVSASGSYDSGTGIWTNLSLAAGASTTLTMTATATQSGAWTNTAQVQTASTPDPDSTPGNSNPAEDDQASVVLSVPETSDLELTKTVNNATPYVGQTVTYSITVTNRGPDAAEGVSVRDVLPAGISYVSHTGGSYDSGTGLWGIGGLAVGASVTLNITATVTQAGAITNFAQVSAAAHYDPDSTPNNAPPYTEDDDDFVVITAAPAADLQLTKSVNNSTPNVGGSVVFTVTVTNQGPSASTGSTVRDLLPAGLSYVSHSGGAYVPGTGDWTLGALAVGGSTSLTITATVTNSGNIQNIAQVWTANEFDSDSTPGNSVPAEDDQDDAELVVPPAVDLELAKSVDNATPSVGDSIVYTVVVTNRGVNNATGVTILDVLPAGLSYVSHSGPGTYVSGTGIWTIGGPLTPQSGRTLQITALVAASGTITNFAQVQTAGEYDVDSTPGNAPPFTEDDDALAVIVVAPSADLELTKSVDNSTPNVGQSVVFTIVVTNRGPDNATGVTVEDILPAGLAYASDNGGGDYVAGTGIWTIGALAVGGTESLQITATVTNSGNIENIAQVEASNEEDIDSTPGNNLPNEDDQDNATLLVPPASDLELSKSVNNATPSVGATIVYTVVVTNRGVNNATGVTILDVLPAGLAYVSHLGPGTYVPGTGVWTIGGPMTPGSGRTLQITATVTASGTITNFAQVQTADQFDLDSTPGNAPPYTEDDDAFAVITVAPAADLELLKSVNNGTPNVGSNVTFTVVVTNRGPDNATGVTVEDILPAGLAYVSHSGGAYVPGTGIWTIGALAVGGSTNLQITAAVTNSGNIQNIAQVQTADQFDVDSTPGNDLLAEDDQDDALLTVAPAADLELSKVVDDATPNVGDTIQYTVVITNRGPNNAPGILVADALPAGLAYVGHSNSVGTLYAPGTGLWSFGGPLVPGASRTLWITATVTNSGVMTNFAQVTAAGAYDPDSTPSNAPPYTEDDDAFVVIAVDPAADLELTKTVDDSTPLINDIITFTVAVSNRGPDVATGVTVADVLPAGLSYQAHSGGSYDSGSGIWTLGTIGVGAVTTLQVQAEVTVGGSVLTNLAQVATANEFDVDSTPGNYPPDEDDSDTAQVSVGDAADLELTKTVDDATPNVGDNVIFTLTVTNNGPNAASGVTVADLLPAGLGYVSHSGGTYDSGTGAWTIGNLAVGGSTNLQITASIDDYPRATNIAQVLTANEFDPDSTPGNYPEAEDDDAVAIVTPPVADLEVTKDVDKVQADPFENVVWTVTVTNKGPSPATGVTVYDPLPTNWVYVSDSSGAYDTNTSIWTIGTLPAGGSTSLSVTAYATLGVSVMGHGPVPPGYTNVAEIWTVNEYDIDSTPGNGVLAEDDQDDAFIPIRALSDLKLIKTVNNATPYVGSQIAYTIVVTNEGPQPASGVLIEDVLPAGLTYVSNSVGAAYSPASGIWDIGLMLSGWSRTLTVWATVDVPGLITNIAQVSNNEHYDADSMPDNDDPLEDDQDDAVIDGQPLVDVELDKLVNMAEADPFENVVWSVTVTNKGPSTATGLTVYDPLPTNWVYVSDSSGAYDTNTSIWTIGTLPAGGSTSLAITAYATLGVSVMGHGPIPPGYTNVAQVWTLNEDDVDSTPGNNMPAEDDQDDAFIPIRALTDLKLTKSVDNSSPYVGEQIAYTIVVTNEGPQPASGVRVEDVLPAGLTYVSNSLGSAYSPISGIWDIGRLNSATSKTLTIWLTVDVPGLITNIAQVNNNEHFDIDSTPNNYPALNEDDDDSVVIDVQPLVDVELDKTVDKAEADPFENVVWSLTVTNKGPSAATGLAVYDPLPANWVWVSDTSSGAYDTNTSIWTIGALPSGGSTSLAITAYATLGVTVTGHGPVPPGYTNIAQVWTLNEDDVDSTPGNSNPAEDDQDDAQIPIRALSDLALTKSVDDPTPNLGQEIAFTIVVTNEGPQPAVGVLIEDVLPAGLSYVSNSVGSAYNSGTGIWDIGLILSARSKTLTIWATVQTTAVITNIAQVNNNEHYDLDSTPDNDDPLEDDQDQVVVTPNPAADLELTKVATTSVSNVGQSVTFVITVTNRGPDNATGVTVQDLLEAGLDYVSHSGGAFDTNTAIWTIGALNVGSSTSLTVTAQVTTSGDLHNFAQVQTADQFDIDSTPGNSAPEADVEDDEKTVELFINPASDIELDKGVDNGAPNVGDTVVFTIGVTNRGPDTAQITVQDMLPAGLAYVSDTSGGSYVPGTGLWNVGTLAVGGSASFTLTVTVTNSGSITNTAQVQTSDHFDPDSTPGNSVPGEDDQDEAVLAVPPAADLALTKTVDRSVAVAGSNVVFTLVLTNSGPDAATGVVVEDVLPAGLTYVSHAGGAYDSGTGLWTVGNLALHASTNLQITVTVTGSGILTNLAQVNVSGQYDPDSTPDNDNPQEDDQDEERVTVVAPGIRLVKTVDDTADGAVRDAPPGADIAYVYQVINTGDTFVANIVVTDDVLGSIGTLPGPVAPGSVNNFLFATHVGVQQDVVNVGVAVGNPTDSQGNDLPGLPDVTASDDAVVHVPFLSIEKEDLPDPVRPGGALAYTLWIANPSPHSVSNVVVTETYPPQFAFGSALPAPSTSNNVWNLGTLAAGDLVPIVIQGVVSGGAVSGSVLTNRITVTSHVITNTVLEPTRVVSNPPPGRAEIRLTKRDLMDPVGPGSNLVYAIRVENHGPSTATNVVVTDTYDPIFTFTGSGPAPSSSNNVWNLGSLAMGAWREIYVTGTVSVAATDGTLVTNRAVATANNADPSADDEITLVLTSPPPPPEIFKTASTNFALAGQTLIYTITVQNASAVVVPGAVVVETYGELFQYGSSVPAPVPGTSNLWYLGDLAPSSTTSIVITGTVKTNFASTALLFNTAELITDFGSRTVHATTTVAKLGSLGDFAWDDLDGDGIQDAGEPGVPNVTVGLYGPTTNLLGTTLTAANGRYAFTNLNPGTYFLRFTRPSGYQFTPNNHEHVSGDGVDSDANPTTGDTPLTVLAAGEVDLTWDAGFYRPASVGDYVWLDEDWDGVQDAGEAGIPNVKIQLLNNTGGVVRTTVTDLNGLYLFSELLLGTYTVKVDTTSLPANLAANPTFDPDGTKDHKTTVTLGSGVANLAADFGYNWTPTTSPKGTIGDRVWRDADADGIQDTGEPGIPNVRVRLYVDAALDGSYSSQIAAVFTDGAGGYVFNNLNPGSYVVRVDTATLPATFIQTGDPDSFGGSIPAGQGDHRTTQPIVLAPGDVFVNVDFGYWFPNGSDIGDLIYFDANANGAYNPASGDSGIANVTVVLLNTSGKIIASTITDATGFYLFTGLPAGTYAVWVNDVATQLEGLVPSGDPDGIFDNRSTVSVNGVNDNLLQDFGYKPDRHNPGLGLIGDFVFLDRNGDGTSTLDEGIQGVTVRLYDSTGTSQLATTFTDPDGHYYFGGLAAGTYMVRVATNTLPNGGVGLRNSVDPDTANPGNSQSLVTIAAGGINLLQDFGYVPVAPNAIGGTLWRDCDADGILDSDETPRWEGVQIILRNTAGKIMGSTFTDASGNYRFSGMPNGTYTVDVNDIRNVMNGFWHSLGPNLGSDNNSQRDPYTVTVSGGQTNTTGDFGYYLVIAELGDYVWYDINGNGLQDGGEPGLSGVKVTLKINYPNGSQIVMQTKTDSSGRYVFANLLLDERYNQSTMGNPATTGLPRFQISIVSTQTILTADGYVATRVNAGSGANDSRNHAGVFALLQKCGRPAVYDFGYRGGPLLAVIGNVDAFTRDGQTIVRWETIESWGTAGFWLERQVGDQWVRISQELIPFPLFEPSPIIYEEVDPGAVAGGTYIYRLVELESDGDELTYGPYTLTVDGPGRTYADWAAEHFTAAELADPAISGQDADPDGDGLTNWQEFLAGTDPNNADSLLQVTSVRRVEEGLELRWKSVAGRYYRIALSDSMFGPFLPLEQSILATDENGHVTLSVDFQDRQLYFQVILVHEESP